MSAGIPPTPADRNGTTAARPRRSAPSSAAGNGAQRVGRHQRPQKNAPLLPQPSSQSQSNTLSGRPDTPVRDRGQFRRRPPLIKTQHLPGPHKAPQRRVDSLVPRRVQDRIEIRLTLARRPAAICQRNRFARSFAPASPLIPAASIGTASGIGQLRGPPGAFSRRTGRRSRRLRSAPAPAAKDVRLVRQVAGRRRRQRW